MGCRVRCEVVDRKSNLSDIVLYEQFGPRISPVEQPWRCDVSQIPDETRAQQTDEPEYIILLSCFDDGTEPFVYEAVIVVFACGVLAPARTRSVEG